MTLVLNQTATALAANLQAYFFASGGTAPYTYSVAGAGGSIDSATGLYTAPAVTPYDAAASSDVVTVTDSVAATATASILIGTPLLLLCEIIQSQMGLAPGRVYLWDQKIFQPSDSSIYIAVSELTCRPFGNINMPAVNGSALDQAQYVAMHSMIDIDIMSRSTEAMRRKPEVLMALASVYSQQQQSANSFFIGRLPPAGRFVNLSNVDGAAIPYRYRISVAMQYAYVKQSAAPYYSSIQAVDLVTDA